MARQMGTWIASNDQCVRTESVKWAVMVQDATQTIPWKLILSKPPVWALIVSHFCHNWGTFILLTWMPTYYNQVTPHNEPHSFQAI